MWMQNRNRNVDILRALSLLLIIIYHIWVLTGSIPFRFGLVTMIISLGGEIGVTAFFALSGYGIYCSISKMEEQGTLKYGAFMKKRLSRILPAYYVSLILCLFFMDQAFYLSKEGIGNIAAHVLLIHNLHPDYFGTINGVLWTMGLTFQFYLIAIPLYKGMKKMGSFFYLLGILFTVFVKALTLHYLVPMFELQDNLFYAGRQLLPALDSFLVGMFAAYLLKKDAIKCKSCKCQSWMGVIVSLVGVACLIGVCKLGLRYGIHSDNWSGYTWHSLIALSLGIMMFGFSQIKISDSNVIVKALLWLSNYEYGIYLVHLVIILNLIQRAPVIQYFMNNGYKKTWFLVLTVIVIACGWGFELMVDTAWKKIQDKTGHV